MRSEIGPSRRTEPPGATIRAVASHSTTAFAAGALVLAGCAVGLLLGRWTVSRPEVERDTPASAAQPDLTPLLAEIRRSNDALLLAIRERREPQPSNIGGGAREPVATDPAPLDRLATAVEKLNGLLARGAGGTGSGWVPTEQVQGAGFRDLQALWDRIDALKATGGSNWQEAADTELTAAYHLWTVEDLFTRYGNHARVQANGTGLEILYRRPNAPEKEEEPEVLFEIAHGLVSGVVPPR